MLFLFHKLSFPLFSCSYGWQVELEVSRGLVQPIPLAVFCIFSQEHSGGCSNLPWNHSWAGGPTGGVICHIVACFIIEISISIIPVAIFCLSFFDNCGRKARIWTQSPTDVYSSSGLNRHHTGRYLLITQQKEALWAHKKQSTCQWHLLAGNYQFKQMSILDMYQVSAYPVWINITLFELCKDMFVVQGRQCFHSNLISSFLPRQEIGCYASEYE